MQPEPPIFFLSADNRFLDVRRAVDDAEEHLTGHHVDNDQFVLDLLYFDGLARPVEARVIDRRVKLAVTHAAADPWQVRARAVEAIRRLNEWVAAQGETVVIHGGREVSKAEVEEQLRNVEPAGYDTSFADFTFILVSGFDPMGHRGSFLHNLFHW